MSEEESRESRKLQEAKERMQRRKEWLSKHEIPQSEQTKLCPNCRKEIHLADNYCVNCGEELPDFEKTIPHPEEFILCPYCAEEIKTAAIVCKHCGRELNGFQDTISKTQDSYARELVRKDKPLEISIRRIFDFKGKANRTEYIVYNLGPTLCLVIPMLFLSEFEILESEICPPILAVFFLISIISNISVAVRRFHDLGRDGLLVFLLIVPLVNVITGLYLLFTPGSTKMEKKKRRKSGW